MGKPLEPHPGLLRVLGPVTAVAVVVGSIIGSGIFKKPQAVAQNIQYIEWALVAWVLGGVLALLGSLVVAELGAMLPRAGGNYVFLKEGFGPLWGFLWGWVDFWILRTGSIAALATIFTESLHEILKSGVSAGDLLEPWEQKWVTVGVIAFLVGINALGVRWGGLVQNVTTGLKVASLVVIAVLPFAMGQAHLNYLAQPGRPPESGNVLVGFGAAVLGVLWAYHGWMLLTPLAEELRDPQRNIPRAMFIGVGLVIAVYLCANLAYAVVLPLETMADKDQVKVVAVSFARAVFRGEGAMDLAGNAVSAAIMVSVFGALNANILIGPRTYFALGRDGLFPKSLGEVHPRFRTPVYALLLQGAWAIGLVLGSEVIQKSKDESPFDTLTNYVMFGAIIFETMVIASIFRFRRLHPDWPRPYRCWGYPVVPVVYIIVLVLVLANTLYDQPEKSGMGFLFIVAGALVYFLVVRPRGARPNLGGDSYPV